MVRDKESVVFLHWTAFKFRFCHLIELAFHITV